MADGQQSGIDVYFRLMNHNGAAEAFRVAERAGIMDSLFGGPASRAEIARRCGTKDQPTALLIDCLIALGVVVEENEHVRLSAAGAFLRTQYRDLGNSYWQHAPGFLATGEPIMVVPDKDSLEAFYQAQAKSLGWMMRPSAEAAADLLGIGSKRRGLHLLDAGCGSAVFSLVCAARDSEARVTALDWPAVVGIAGEEARKAGLDGRFTAIAGNYHAADLPEGSYDLAIAANITHLETNEGNLSLFRKLHRALKPGGEIAIIDVFPGSADARLGAALYAFGLALRNKNGRVHGEETLSGLLRKAGFAPEPVASLVAPPHVMGLLLARKA